MAHGNKMKIVGVMATCGRHYYCERAVGMFLQQSHPDKHLIIIQNSSVHQTLDKDYSNITLINKSDFSNLGQVYNEAIKHIPWDGGLWCCFDDDDVFLPNHFEEGEAGYIRGKKKAYKPKFSYFWNANKITPMSNVLETSWFIETSLIKSLGFREESKKHHFNWIDNLLATKQVYVDETGPKTMCCVWGQQEKPLYHSSGDGSPNNFNNFRKASVDHGDKVITPWTLQQLDPIYGKFRNLGI
jgi:hypothetical protein